MPSSLCNGAVGDLTAKERIESQRPVQGAIATKNTKAVAFVFHHRGHRGLREIELLNLSVLGDSALKNIANEGCNAEKLNYTHPVSGGLAAKKRKKHEKLTEEFSGRIKFKIPLFNGIKISVY